MTIEIAENIWWAASNCYLAQFLTDAIHQRLSLQYAKFAGEEEKQRWADDLINSSSSTVGHFRSNFPFPSKRKDPPKIKLPS